jgi:hypothetical protein
MNDAEPGKLPPGAAYVFTFVRGEAEKGPPRDVIAERFRAGIWPLGDKTRHQKDLATGDRIAIYVPGRKGTTDAKTFLATGRVSGPLQVTTVRGQYGLTLGKTVTVPVRDLMWLPRSVPLSEVLEGMEFIRVKENYGSYFIGRITKLSAPDFDAIVAAGERVNSNEGPEPR